MITIAYDTTLRRPGCAIVQRALGATISQEDLGRMNGWLTSPTPDMKVLPLQSRDEIETVIVLTNHANPEDKA